MRRVVALSLLLVSCGAAPTGLWTRPGLEGQLRPGLGHPEPGDVAPDFTLSRPDGSQFHLADTRGSWVLLHFTMTWCPYCDAEVEHVAEIAARYPDLRVALIDVEEPIARWHAYVREHVHEPSLVVLEDPGGQAAASFAPPSALPTLRDRSQAMAAVTVVLDPAGKIRLFVLPDSRRYDPTLGAILTVTEELSGISGTVPPRPAAPIAETPAAPDVAAADVVAIHAAPLTMHTRERSTLVVTLHIADGYHTMSDHPSDELYVATTLTLDDTPGVSFASTTFPAPSQLRLGDASLSVFAGEVEARIPVTAAETPLGPVVVRGTLRYQACTATRCLPPTTQRFDATLTVAR